MATDRPVIDMFNAESFAHGHPWAEYDRLREQDPVSRQPGTEKQPTDIHLLTRHADIEKVSFDPVRFVSSRGSHILTDRKIALDMRVGKALRRILTDIDAPDHTILRKLLVPAFSPVAMKKLEDGVNARVSSLLDHMKDRKEVEFVEEIAAVTPIETLCILLGIPEVDWPKFFDWTNAMAGIDDPEFSPTLEKTNKAFQEVFDYGAWLINERRKDPKDDVMSILARGELDGKHLDEDTQNGLVTILFVAGNESTRNSTTGSIIALSNNPGQKQRLLDDPSLIQGGVDELLRYVSPFYQMARTAAEDTEIDGKPIAKGEKLVLLYGAANRDPAMFPDPHRLDVTRKNAARQLSFGVGIHHCVGMRMAQLQIRTVLRELLKRFPKFDLAAEPELLKSNFIYGVRRLPVQLN